MTSTPLVGIIVGSASDLPHAEKCAAVLRELGVLFEVGAASAHRTPSDVVNYAKSAKGRGIRCIIAMAGLSAALPGVIAAHTTLPVIGVPIANGAANGFDALLSIVQMPPGVPVASMGIDGAKNAALMAARIIATTNGALTDKLIARAEESADDVRASRRRVEEKFLPHVPDSVFEGEE